MNNQQRPLAKVLFRILEEDGSANVETLWAHDLGESQYRLANLPFYAYSVSFDDVVLAPPNADEGFPKFERVISKSGNRTVRVILGMPAEPSNRSSELLNRVGTLGCGYEEATKKYLTLNIPPDVALADVTSLLQEFDVEWEHADPTYSELYPDNP